MITLLGPHYDQDRTCISEVSLLGQSELPCRMAIREGRVMRKIGVVTWRGDTIEQIGVMHSKGGKIGYEGA
eukprot:756760-Hanusia_phi.AAC.6